MLRWLLLLVALPTFAHENEALQPHDLWTAWTWDPIISAGLLLSAWLYWRGDRPEHGIRGWERACYWVGWVWLVLALLSPIHALSEVLFSAHMVQHEILMLICAPLLVLGRPVVAFVWALPPSWRRHTGQLMKTAPAATLWTWLTRPFNAWWIHAIALWGWHAPALFRATLTSDLIHALQHMSFLGTALLFWWSLFRRHENRSTYGSAVFYIFTTAVHSSILGALLTFSPTPWYSPYISTTPVWGLTPLEDQQLGGLVMWIPAGFVFVAAGLVFFGKWMQNENIPARGLTGQSR